MSKGLNPGQNRRSVGPDLGSNSLEGDQQTKKVAPSIDRVNGSAHYIMILSYPLSYLLG